MPQHKSAVKRTRQIEKRRKRNVPKRTHMKTALKKIRETEDAATAQKELKNTVSTLDKMAVKGLIHKNKAANLKSKLMRMVNRKSAAAK
jgi:small subunit ribosomal protein S20